jgi:hypothetical protein
VPCICSLVGLLILIWLKAFVIGAMITFLFHAFQSLQIKAIESLLQRVLRGIFRIGPARNCKARLTGPFSSSEAEAESGVRTPQHRYAGTTELSSIGFHLSNIQFPLVFCNTRFVHDPYTTAPCRFSRYVVQSQPESHGKS